MVDKKGRQQSWQFFICHATEDKEEIARPLADALTSRGFDVWYDEFSLTLGDSLRRKIDQGLAESRYGIVILSPNFFAKDWPQKELDALVSREAQSGETIILPIWHNIDRKTVSKFSALLADRIAVSTSKSLDHVVGAIINAVNCNIERGKFFDEEFVNINFKRRFSSKLDQLVNLLDSGGYSSQIDDLIDIIIMEFKEQIDKWDSPSVKFATKELFTRLYKYSEKNGFCELYIIFEDLFARAYSQRRRLIGLMIQTFNLLLFSCWVPLYDIEQGEKAAKVMLRLGIDFLDKDVPISEDCLIAIDNLAGDMFEPEILSKEILLCACAHQKSVGNPELQEFVEQYTDWIRINDEYSWDAEIKTYLRDSIEYAEGEQKNYGVDIATFKKEKLLPALEQNIDDELHGYIEFIGELESEGDDDLEFPIEDLSKIILAYEFLHPRIAFEIKELVTKKDNPYITTIFNRIIENSNFLKKIYRGSEMITTFDELIRFLETSSDMENLSVGVTTYGLSWIDFKNKLNDSQKKAIEDISEKYGLQEDGEFELGDQNLTFLVDTLVYLGDNQHNMQKLIDFLKQINEVASVENFVTGMEFKLRHTSP